MTSRILPRAEWPRLVGTELEHVWPVLSEEDRIVVVEEDGAIVACHGLWWALHLDGLWKQPGTGAGVSRLLWETVQQTAWEMGARTVMTTAIDPRVRRLLTHVDAVPVPGEFFVVPMKERERCQR